MSLTSILETSFGNAFYCRQCNCSGNQKLRHLFSSICFFTESYKRIMKMEWWKLPVSLIQSSITKPKSYARNPVLNLNLIFTFISGVDHSHGCRLCSLSHGGRLGSHKILIALPH